MRDLVVYPNCSKGGVSTVIRARAVAEPRRKIDAVFFEDRGGAHVFDELPNLRSLIIRRDRSAAALAYMASTFTYERASVLSSPSTVEHLAGKVPLLRYEFHSSDLDIVRAEIGKLALSHIDEISAPTQYMAEHVSGLLPRSERSKVLVVPNLVDTGTFHPDGPSDFGAASADAMTQDGTPLVWVGRFDKGKGHRHFARMLAAMPSDYYGVVVVSLEKEPERVAAFLSECASMGVLDRVRIYLNLPQHELASLYRWARDRGGWAVSTSLLESFGYFVAESTSCGLRVAAFDLPVWKEHERRHLIHSVPIGSVRDLAEIVRAGAR
ncbi:MAG: glycosyltransferase [Patulibacter sp.]